MARRTRSPAAARLAPFTRDEVASLIAGQPNHPQIGRLLAAHREPRLPSPTQRAAVHTGAVPVRVGGQTPRTCRFHLQCGR